MLAPLRFRLPPLALLACALAAAPALASQVNLRWDACWGDGGAVNRSFACDTNLGSERLVVSFVPPQAVPAVTSVISRVRFTFPGATIPAWWQFKSAGTCRSTSLTAVGAPPAGAISCLDWAGGAGLDAFVTYAPPAVITGTTSADLTVLSPFLPAGAFDLAAGREYAACVVMINHQKTVGTGACSGCDLGACAGVLGVDLVRESPLPVERLLPNHVQDQVVTWQGGSGVAIPDLGGAGYIYCPGATKARPSVWGALKALYR